MGLIGMGAAFNSTNSYLLSQIIHGTALIGAIYW